MGRKLDLERDWTLPPAPPPSPPQNSHVEVLTSGTYLRMEPYLENKVFAGALKVRSYWARVALIQVNWCHIKETLDTDTGRHL